MEKVDEAGLGAAGFITVTCRVCWLWVYDVTPWLYPGLGARRQEMNMHTSENSNLSHVQ